MEERKIEKADASAAEDIEEGAAPRRERKTRVAKKERVKKEDKDAINASVVSKYAKDEEIEE